MHLHENEKSTNASPILFYQDELNQSIVTSNASMLLAEKRWLTEVVVQRVNAIESGSVFDDDLLTPIILTESGAFADLVHSWRLNASERLLLLVGLLPYIAPQTLTALLRDEQHVLRVRFPEFGGVIDPGSRHFIPTMQTALFLLCGADEEQAMYQELFFREKSRLFRDGVLQEQPSDGTNERTNARNQLLLVMPEYVDYLLTTRKPNPGFGRSFPATQVQSPLTWDDLVLPPATRKGVNEFVQYLEVLPTLVERSKRFNASTPCLFYGSPGTGKTLTASLIGKHLSREVYKVDLSMVVSKYVGETEKNLAYLFDRAKGRDWILFFDEADSLFSSRTSVGSAQDKWANLEVSYLLQRLEEHQGVTILSTNLKGNLDNAMIRRFRFMINFARPNLSERKILWQKSLPAYYHYAEDVDLTQLAQHDLTGANIANILLKACVSAELAQGNTVTREMLLHAIRDEFLKENRTP
ncbi:MAG: ATP-binding protein [Salibacteraceae bacterium]